MRRCFCCESFPPSAARVPPLEPAVKDDGPAAEMTQKRVQERAVTPTVDLGIGNWSVPICSHVAYLCEIRFVEAGLRSSDHCLVIGDELDTGRILSNLRPGRGGRSRAARAWEIVATRAGPEFSAVEHALPDGGSFRVAFSAASIQVRGVSQLTGSVR